MDTVTKFATTVFQHDDLVTLNTQVHGHSFVDRTFKSYMCHHHEPLIFSQSRIVSIVKCTHLGLSSWSSLTSLIWCYVIKKIMRQSIMTLADLKWVYVKFGSDAKFNKVFFKKNQRDKEPQTISLRLYVKDWFWPIFSSVVYTELVTVKIRC
jgi:hypothetical protein